jgi:hypothetical protein
MAEGNLTKLSKLFRFYQLVTELNNFKTSRDGDIELFARQFLLITSMEEKYVQSNKGNN